MQKASDPLRLNLGCGNQRKAGWLNVDMNAKCAPDLICDLEVFPWPWETSSVVEIMLDNVLEHLGAVVDVYFMIIKEMYRVCAPGALVHVRAPHPRHDYFMWDPTHVRPITLDGMHLFDQRVNQYYIDQGRSNNPLGIYLGVNFHVKSCEYILDTFIEDKLKKGELTEPQIDEMMRLNNNIVSQINIVLEAVKE